MRIDLRLEREQLRFLFTQLSLVDLRDQPLQAVEHGVEDAAQPADLSRVA